MFYHYGHWWLHWLLSPHSQWIYDKINQNQSNTGWLSTVGNKICYTGFYRAMRNGYTTKSIEIHQTQMEYRRFFETECSIATDGYFHYCHHEFNHSINHMDCALSRPQYLLSDAMLVTAVQNDGMNGKQWSPYYAWFVTYFHSLPLWSYLYLYSLVLVS